MKVHHLNCATCCPFGGHLFDGITPGIRPARIVCHTLLIESENGHVLIDTGLGMNDVHHPQRINPILRRVLRPVLQEHETAYRQVFTLGLKPTDVKHIVLTHLDFDHAGGIEDFPNATVHVMQNELNAALTPNRLIDKCRYCSAQLIHSNTWTTYNLAGEKWYGFEAVRQLIGLPPEILLVPLTGHTEGHAGVAIETDKGWLLYAGDAYFYRGELDPEYHCTPGLKAYQKLMEVNRGLRLHNQQRLRDLAHNFKHEVTIFSAHDAIEYLSLRESGETVLGSTRKYFETNNRRDEHRKKNNFHGSHFFLE